MSMAQITPSCQMSQFALGRYQQGWNDAEQTRNETHSTRDGFGQRQGRMHSLLTAEAPDRASRMPLLAGTEVWTVQALGSRDDRHPVEEAFRRHHAAEGLCAAALGRPRASPFSSVGAPSVADCVFPRNRASESGWHDSVGPRSRLAACRRSGGLRAASREVERRP